MKHIKAFTYEPKIEAVRNGTCRQTIRPLGKRPAESGDIILFHGWEGRPYRSRWSWRLDVHTNYVETVLISPKGISFINTIFGGNTFREWKQLDALAKYDGIESGKEMGKLFNKMYDLRGGKEFQIIRW